MLLQKVARGEGVYDSQRHDRTTVSKEMARQSEGIRNGPGEWGTGARHQGQRLADRGRWRLQGRQTSREREVLIVRSIDAAISAAGSDRSFSRDFPEQDQVRKSGRGSLLRGRMRPFPASLETLMKVSMHMLSI